MSDYEVLKNFWDNALALTDEERAYQQSDIEEDDWKQFALSEKLLDACCSLGTQSNVLDYGCGNGWATVVMGKAGAGKITSVDVTEKPIEATTFYAKLFGLENTVEAKTVDENWLAAQPSETYDGIFCSNVLDVIPPEIASDIIRNLARLATADGTVIIGMNYYDDTPETLACEDRKVYVDGVLRMVSRSDEEWTKIFEEFFTVTKLEHFAWPQETEERRRLFYLKKK